MRPFTKQRARANRQAAPLRRAFLEEFPTCMVRDTLRGCGIAATDVHEIARGTAARPRAIAERACWLALCRQCHNRMGESDWPVERQLALKLLCDPGYFDIETVNQLRGRAPGAITLEDVAGWLQLR